MLKGISPLISPQLLKTIAEMGHGDEIVIGDANFPAKSLNPNNIRADGHGVVELLDAILALLPLDTYVEAPVTLMAVPDGQEKPAIWESFTKTIEKHQKDIKYQYVDRMAFYELSKKAYATVATGERALYACIILKKGVI
ncbi:MAG: L-fucose mutarotase [Eubacteriales bacterium]|nr:L-fucose mutarotase [Eubacteriales bacterium]